PSSVVTVRGATGRRSASIAGSHSMHHSRAAWLFRKAQDTTPIPYVGTTALQLFVRSVPGLATLVGIATVVLEPHRCVKFRPRVRAGAPVFLKSACQRNPKSAATALLSVPLFTIPRVLHF